MKVALLRVGVDTGAKGGGIYGPLHSDGSFELIWIPDHRFGDGRTYGTLEGKNQSRRLIEYFPKARQAKMTDQSVHVDPEFQTYTYGDPHRPRLCYLTDGDILAFFCGLKGWGDCTAGPALYLIGHFEVTAAGPVSSFSGREQTLFANNFHVRNHDRRPELALVKGGTGSRLLKKAVKIATLAGQVSPDMRDVFGDVFGTVGDNRTSVRAGPWYVAPHLVGKAASFVRSIS